MFKVSGKAVSTLLAVGLAGVLAGSWAAPATARQVCYFGECSGSVSQAPSTKPTATQMIAKRGSWSAHLVGEIAMLVDEFQNGAKFAVVFYPEGKPGLMLMHPNWNLQKGQQVEMIVRIDGEAYKGTATAIENNVLTVKGVSRGLLQTFYRGRQGRIEVADFAFDMSNLADAAAVFDDMLARLKTASR
ncbi:MAG: hypothetical protein AB7O88_22645 [Reyranellaceae bacterium]